MSIQATEEHSQPRAHDDAHAPHLETHAENERMRHIPAIPWIVQKLDGDVRRTVEKLWLPYSDLPASDPRHPAIEAAFRSLGRWLDRVTDIARRHRGHPHPPNDLHSRLTWSIGQAISALQSGDSDTFGKRFPFHTGERSASEPLWAAVLAVLHQLQHVVELVREIDPGIDERLYEGLVQLKEPLRREPIA